MDAVKAKIKEQDEKLAEMQKQEELWIEFDKDSKERLQKPLEMKEIPLPTQPTVSKDEIEKQKNAANEVKQQLETQLAELVSDNLEVNLPPALKEEKRDNIILLGPLGCGKTTACNFLS